MPQLSGLHAAAAEYGVLAVPGMEINTSEEVHVSVPFPYVGEGT